MTIPTTFAVALAQYQRAESEMNAHVYDDANADASQLKYDELVDAAHGAALALLAIPAPVLNAISNKLDASITMGIYVDEGRLSAIAKELTEALS